MKSFTFLPLALLLALILTAVNGTPISREEADIEFDCEYEPGATAARNLESRAKPGVTTFIKWLNTNKARVAEFPAIMFSGRSGKVHSQTGARKLATEHKGKTIGDLTRMAKVDYKLEKWDKEDFRQVCRVWSQNAAGTVYVSLGKTVPPGSTYETVEKPALQDNKEVKAIMESIIDEHGKLGDAKDAKKK